MHDVSADELQRACGLLGDTVLDPAVWPLAMDEICRAVGAGGAMLLQGDVRTPDIPRTASFDEQTQCYFRGDWHIRDTRANYAVPLLLRGASVVIDQDIMSTEQIIQRMDAWNAWRDTNPVVNANLVGAQLIGTGLREAAVCCLLRWR